jgi:hypothetical protein
MSYDNTGKVSLWVNEKHDPSGRQPRLKGKLFAHRDYSAGEEIDIALWDNSSENPKAPAMSGKLSDKYVADNNGAATSPAPAAVQAQMNDEIPF